MRTFLALALLLAFARTLAEEKAGEERTGHEAQEAEEAAAPQRPGEGLPGDVSGEGKPPPGAPEDQALWAEAHEITMGITTARIRANRLQWEARDRKYDERLGALAGRSSGPARQKAEELQKAYRAALGHNYLTLVRRWPVDPTRGCQYPMLHLASAMRSGKPALLQPSRADARDCVEKARPAVQVMEASSAEVERLSAEAAKLLDPAAPAPEAAAR